METITNTTELTHFTGGMDAGSCGDGFIRNVIDFWKALINDEAYFEARTSSCH